MDARSHEVFTLKLYASLATGSTLGEATALAQTALSAINSGVTLRLKSLSPDLRLVEAVSSIDSIPTASHEFPLPDPAVAAAAIARDAEALTIQRELRAAAVFVGAAGIGPWQEQELNGFLREFVSRKSPVIPVLLQDAPEKPELPIFLRAMTWVDFRVKEPEPLARLIWGITGNRPGN